VTYDPTATYRSAQVTTSSPTGQVVLLYEGAIRFSSLSVVRLEHHDLAGAHEASLRAQAIISALRESLDLSAGDVATHLDGLYEFLTRRLIAGNLARDPRPAGEVIGLLRELLAAWRAIAAPTPATVPNLAPPRPSLPAVPSRFRVGVPGAA
jgi:flagellar secretion chaperone FliS